MPIDEQAIRERIEKKFKKRQEWLAHVISYVLVNVFLWLLFFIIPDPQAREFPWPLIVMFGWGIGLAIHTFDYFAGERLLAQREAAVEKAILQERARLYGDPYYEETEKPKHRSNREISLSEDGELVYNDDTDIPTQRQQRQ